MATLKERYDALVKDFTNAKIPTLIDYLDLDYTMYVPELEYESDSDSESESNYENDYITDSGAIANKIYKCTYKILGKCTNTNKYVLNYATCAVYIPDYIEEFIVYSYEMNLYIHVNNYTDHTSVLDIDTILSQTRELPSGNSNIMDGYKRYTLLAPYMKNVIILLPEYVPAVYGEIIINYTPSVSNVYYSKYTSEYYSCRWPTNVPVTGKSIRKRIEEFNNTHPNRLLKPYTNQKWVFPIVSLINTRK